MIYIDVFGSAICPSNVKRVHSSARIIVDGSCADRYTFYNDDFVVYLVSDNEMAAVALDWLRWQEYDQERIEKGVWSLGGLGGWVRGRREERLGTAHAGRYVSQYHGTVCK